MIELEQARQVAAAADRLVVFSGAGLSAESGLPTFRDKGTGLWARYDPMQLASVEGFSRHPDLVLEWYAWRRNAYAEARPNAAHDAIVASDVRVVTQNVDGLLEEAGIRNENLVHLHGRIDQDRCHAGCGYLCEIDLATATPEPLTCPDCGAPLRPGVVWFGEALPPEPWSQATAWCESADCLLVVGTSGAVYPAADMASIARNAGATVIDVNPRRGGLDSIVDIKVRLGAAEAVPAILGVK
ncbi:MAG: NAD-dependent protein deacylase [Phycisphaerales bacterium]|nr:NAD-dependent protein deacylase [Phycisphaerales bacterium]